MNLKGRIFLTLKDFTPLYTGNKQKFPSNMRSARIPLDTRAIIMKKFYV